jgi:hypothetical protein
MDKRNKYTPEQVEWLKQNASKLSLKELALKMDRSPETLRAVLIRFGFRSVNTLRRNNNKLKLQNQKQCCSCQSVLPLNEENFALKGNGSFRSECRGCMSDYNKTYQKEHYKDKFSSPAAAVAFRLKQAKNLHKKNPIKTISVSESEALDVFNKQDGKCFYTKVKMKIEPDSPESLSIDRLDSTIGYTKDNIVFCCGIVNKMKSAHTKDEFIKWCKLVASAN